MVKIIFKNINYEFQKKYEKSKKKSKLYKRS